MTFRILVITLVLGLLAAPLAAEAQQAGKIPRIGVLSFPTEMSAVVSSLPVSAFRQGLRELGYVEGQNITIEYRGAGGKAERLAPLAAELVALQVDVIVTSSTPAIRAAKQATKTIPIVMGVSGDAVGAGLVKSLARPGENVTGLTFLDPEVSAKRLQLLKEAVPRVSRVAVLQHTTGPGGSPRTLEEAARSLGLQLQVLTVDGPEDFDRAFGAMKQERAQALAVTASPILFSSRKPLIELAARHRLPAIYHWREMVEDGGLMSYSASLPDMFRRAATYVDKILKGAKPGDLPVEQPTRFELVINLKTAKALGLTIPQSILLRADEVIQ